MIEPELVDPALDEQEEVETLVEVVEAYEVVNDQPTERPEMGAYPEELASILHEYLGPYVRRQNLGRSIIETKFQTTPRNQRRPDLAFISFSQWPKGRRAPNKPAWDLVPDLAVEVISKTDVAWDVLAKVKEYFDAGVKLIWLIYPNLETIHVYTSFTRIEVLSRPDTLGGGDVVPGFQLPLADLFEGGAEPEEETVTETTPTP